MDTARVLGFALAFLVTTGGLARVAAAGGVAPHAPVGRTIHVSQKHLAQVPDTAQFKTIGEAAAIVAPGDTVLIHSGVYREAITLDVSGTPEAPITFQAAPAATVVVTGADKVKGLKRVQVTTPDTIPGAGAPNVFAAKWPAASDWAAETPHPDDDFHALIGRTAQLFVQGYELRQVFSRGQMTRGTFMSDPEASQLYVWAPDNTDISPNTTAVEASVRSTLLLCQASYVNVRGLTFRYAANPAQHGAVIFQDGSHCTVEDCVFEHTNGSGAHFESTDMTVRRCTFQDNGQLGFGANGAHRLLVTDCLVRNNNTKGYNRGWEAGGDKICLSRDVVISQSRFVDNRGTGIWFDIGNEHCTVTNCLIANNENAGIFYEISYGLNAHDNVVVGNGLRYDDPSAWGSNGGIVLSNSSGCKVERNLLVGNREGFNFREQGRTTPRIDDDGAEEVAIRNQDEVIAHNIIACNRDSQTWGWFDRTDRSYLPKAMQAEATKGKATGGSSVAGAATLSLESLSIAMRDNVYAAGDVSTIFGWGATWQQNVAMRSLTDVQTKLGLEQGSLQVDLEFPESASFDFTIPSGSPAAVVDCYPKGDVPGVRLGLR